MSATKHDAGKPSGLWMLPIWALPWRDECRDIGLLIWEFARAYPRPLEVEVNWLQCLPALRFGGQKYAPLQWQRGFNFSRIIDAGLRHATATEALDEESGCPHYEHMLCCALFLVYFSQQESYAAFDDRVRS
jgi:hypothetical protein